MEHYFNTSIVLLPDEIILEEILNKTDIDNFINICKANKRYYEYCSNDLFWKKLYHKYYNNTEMYEDTKSYYETFKLCYQLDYLIKKLKLKLKYSIYNLYNKKSLDLSNNGLSEIPKEIGQLQNLQRLYLGYNKLSEIPKEIRQLQNLQRLYLSYNKLSEIPKEIGQLQHLHTLYLNNNELSEIPKEIGQLKHLKYLYLSLYELSEIPKAIGQLQYLRIYNNNK
jgi:Leucine-rich repeat (LRR) protein